MAEKRRCKRRWSISIGRIEDEAKVLTWRGRERGFCSINGDT